MLRANIISSFFPYSRNSKYDILFIQGHVSVIVFGRSCGDISGQAIVQYQTLVTVFTVIIIWIILMLMP